MLEGKDKIVMPYLLFMLSQRQQGWQVLLSQVLPCHFETTLTWGQGREGEVGHSSYFVTKFKLRWGMREGKRWIRGTGREGGGRTLIMRVFSEHLCSLLLPLLFAFAVETLQSAFPLWKFAANFCFWGRFPLIKCPQFLHDLFILFIIT